MRGYPLTPNTGTPPLSGKNKKGTGDYTHPLSFEEHYCYILFAAIVVLCHKLHFKGLRGNRQDSTIGGYVRCVTML